MFKLGGTIGVVVAAILSWNLWHSWLWAILHGLLSWIYVIYYIFTYV